MKDRYKESVEKVNSNVTLYQIMQDIQQVFITELHSLETLDEVVDYLRSVLSDYNFIHSSEPLISKDSRQKEINGYTLAINVLYEYLRSHSSLNVKTRCTACNSKLLVDLLEQVSVIKLHEPIESRASITSVDIALYKRQQLSVAIFFLPDSKLSDFNRSALLKVIPTIVEIYLSNKLYKFSSQQEFMCESCATISGAKIVKQDASVSGKTMSNAVSFSTSTAIQQEIISALNTPFPYGEFAGKPLHWLIGFKFDYLLDTIRHHDPEDELRYFLLNIAKKAHDINFEGLDDLIPLYNFLKK